MFLLAPLRWLIDLVALLPDVVRPGVFAGLVLLILWFVFVQRGLPNLWHALCRTAARLVDAFIGMLLLPDYLVTTARLRQGQAPARAVLVFGGVAERALDGAGALYQRHHHKPIEWKPAPWKPLAITAVVLTLPWSVMRLTPPASAVRQDLSQAFGLWRDTESWAGVDPSLRAAPGVVWPIRPRVLGYRHRARRVEVTLVCRANDPCKGQLVLRNGAGRWLRTRLLSVKAHTTAMAHLRLRREDAGVKQLLVHMAHANPE